MADIDTKNDEKLVEIKTSLLEKIAYRVSSGYLDEAAQGILILLRLEASRAIRNGGKVLTRDIEVTQLAKIKTALLEKIADKVNQGYLDMAAMGMLALLRLEEYRAIVNGGKVLTRGEDIEVTQPRPRE